MDQAKKSQPSGNEDSSKSTNKNLKTQQLISIDIPIHTLTKVDKEAERIGIPRNSLLKVWITQQTDNLEKNK